MKERKRHEMYEIGFREEIVREHDGGKGYKTIARERGIGVRLIKQWCKWKGEYGIAKQVTGKQLGRPRKRGETIEEEVERLRMEIEILKKVRELL
jgi:transposase